MKKLIPLLFIPLVFACSDDEGETIVNPCISDQIFSQSRGDCNVSLSIETSYSENITENSRIISSNSIPNHMVGLFGNVQGALNPHSISEQNLVYNLPISPVIAQSLIPLQGSNGPNYSFGIMLNGIELDPVAAEPFPHEGRDSPNANWDWNLEATNTPLGLDCNNGHVQPSGQYHYHGAPISYLDNPNLSSDTMNLIGYAADGFPIYYKYAFSEPFDETSSIIEMTTSYRLKTGLRPGDGISAPCDEYNGVYVNDYEYISELGSLDEANGREGKTPEYPNGTYYYIITDDFPGIPRYFKGVPSDDFNLGG